MAFDSLMEIVKLCRKENKKFWNVILEDDMRERDVTGEESIARMKLLWNAMYHASCDYEPERRSKSGLVGGDGQKMEEYCEQKSDNLLGSFVGKCITEALKMSESNACMKRIVAAPTAGSCGVLPSVLVPYFKTNKVEENKILEAMYVAAGIGQVVAQRASVSGAAGGCQAEIGTASAMAAGALVALQGGNENQIIHAAAMALKNLLGLVCDPVAGLVEVPCVKRNVIGTVNAISSAEMAMAGIESRISPDQVIDAMKEIGDKMDRSLKETALGGLATTPDGISICERVSVSQN